jgi:hypothetical protein
MGADHNASPLLVKLSDHLLGRDMQINLGRSKVVMSEEPLQRRQGDISLHGGNGEGMPQDVRAQ